MIPSRLGPILSELLAPGRPSFTLIKTPLLNLSREQRAVGAERRARRRPPPLRVGSRRRATAATVIHPGAAERKRNIASLDNVCLSARPSLVP